MVIDAVRTPVGRASADKGYFRDVRADDLSAHVIQALVKRTGIDPTLIEDVRWGCVQQQGEQGFDIARIAALVAGLPDGDGGVTINRNCASSLQAINDAAMSIAAGCEDVQIAGGVEHMDHVPMTQGLQPLPLAVPPAQRGDHEHGADRRVPGGEVPHPARQAGRVRPAQPPARRRGDRQGRVQGRDHPDLGPRRGGPQGPARPRDQCIRRDTSLEALSALPPAFNPAGGSVTAGNSSPINVGRRRPADDVGGEGPRAGPEADGADPRDGRRRGEPRGDGHRAGPGGAQGAEAGRADARPDRVHRAQRGVRRAGPVACSSCWASTRRR